MVKRERERKQESVYVCEYVMRERGEIAVG